jgi:hypothetical protein
VDKDLLADGVNMTEVQSHPWKVGWKFFCPLNQAGMVVRMLVPRADGKGYTELTVWVAFGCSLLVRADLLISYCMQQPHSYSLQGSLIPNDQKWDGRKAQYLPDDHVMEWGYAEPATEGLPAAWTLKACKKVSIAHFLSDPDAYWRDYVLNNVGKFSQSYLDCHREWKYVSVDNQEDDVDYFDMMDYKGEPHAYSERNIAEWVVKGKKKKDNDESEEEDEEEDMEEEEED